MHARAIPGAANFADDYAEHALWLDDVRFPVLPAQPLPAEVDVLIVGAGLTGLSAAYVTATAGRSTLVLDSAPLGSGCSARNGGQVAPSIKPTFEALSDRIGPIAARAIHGEGLRAMAALRERIETEALDVDWRRCGRLVGAHTPRSFPVLVRAAERYAAQFGVPVSVLARTELAAEIDTDSYHGAVVNPDHASVHPAKLLGAHVERAMRRGARIADSCAALSIRRERSGFTVRTARGDVAARNVLLATDGYTGPLSPWHRRRVIPICTTMIATEPLDPALVRRLLPTARNIVDTRRIVVYYRATPDGRRIVFGGRAGLYDVPAHTYVPRLLGWLRRVFPDLRATRVSRAWSGTVAYTFDTLPHLGCVDGMHYALGYCGSGVSLSTYYGERIGQQILGDPDGRTALDDLPFPGRPYYRRRPWFLAPSVGWFRLLDRLGR